MTLIIYTFILALTVAFMFLGSKKWRETGSEWWVIALFFNMFAMLITGYLVRMQVWEVFNI